KQTLREVIEHGNRQMLAGPGKRLRSNLTDQIGLIAYDRKKVIQSGLHGGTLPSHEPADERHEIQLPSSAEMLRTIEMGSQLRRVKAEHEPAQHGEYADFRRRQR
ncbi:hypothetical protein, partial [Paraburkholderia aspalathi]